MTNFLKINLKVVIPIFLFWQTTLQAQDYFPENYGVKTPAPNYIVFENAKIHIDPYTIIENGTFSIKDGKIAAIGKSIDIPANSIVINLEGKEVYPSFIDVFSDYGIEKPKPVERTAEAQYDAGRQGYYWNDHIRPETNAVEKFQFNKEKALNYYNSGFGVVNTHVPDGIIRGTGVLVALTPEATEGERILNDRSGQYLSFNKSVQSRQLYPTSVMGAMALIRQSYLDAEWYEKGKPSHKDLALEAINRNKSLLQIFSSDNLLDQLRAAKISKEFNTNYVILGSGTEYERVEEIKKSGNTYIIPINFPATYDVENPFLADLVSFQDMKRWNQAPENLKILAKNDVPFVITSYQIENGKDFKNNLLKAVRYGLDKKMALAALTTIPAKILGEENNLGVLKKGAWANFLITSGDYFEEETILYENWVQGKATVLTNMRKVDLAGDYKLNLNEEIYDLKLTEKPGAPKSEVFYNGSKIPSKMTYNEGWLNLILTPTDSESAGSIRLIAQVPITNNDNKISGKAYLINGKTVSFSAELINVQTGDKKKMDVPVDAEIVPVKFPNMPYGFKTMPEQEKIIFKNATVWTNTSSGILKNTDVFVENGKIIKVGENLSVGNARVVDAKGKHLTAGIIDEHTHIAASSINESGHSSTAEVSMEDVIDPTSINIYRNLAGGVTTVQLLHGSANAIGGQSAILKMRWGASAEDMIFKEAPKFIKFALGENPKRTSKNRFPQSRMGVQQVFVDYFTRAKKYEQEKNNNKNYRKDLEMEALAEVLKGERFITSHSYVQSEINMLMKVAESFDFKINIFTHILEGYKVADQMKEHGAGASTFADWWGYKFEVNDAIPYNAAIMHNKGVTVAISSDDSEISRRLNQEAAKSLKYGGMSEEEAWKMVTLNPAKLLQLDEYVGSVEIGKQADLVLWNGNPLSIYSKAEQTLVEGKVYFDIERDKKMRKEIGDERNKLIHQMLRAKNGGASTITPSKKEDQEFECKESQIH